MISRLVLVLALAATAAFPAEPSPAAKPESRPEALPIAEAFRQPSPGKIRIVIGGAEAFVKGEFFVEQGTTLKHLILDTNTARSPLRTTRLFCQAMVSRGSKPFVPWTRVEKLLEGPDVTLEAGDSILVWSLCFGP